MALHIQDKETDELVREFARRRGVGITDAVRVAVQEATQGEEMRLEDFKQRIEPVLAKVRALKVRPYSAEEDKAFMDDMWGEND